VGTTCNIRPSLLSVSKLRMRWCGLGYSRRSKIQLTKSSSANVQELFLQHHIIYSWLESGRLEIANLAK
jgi:hypothetical protein